MELINPEQAGRALGQVLRPTLATSVLKTFGLLSKILFSLAWLIVLPAELILHKRVGKRYMNTIFVFVAMIVFLILANLLVGGFGGPHGAIRFGQSQDQMLAAARAKMDSMRPFSFMTLLVIVGFVLNYRSNRRRFGTPEQGHSCDFGVPWAIFPPLLSRWSRADELATELESMEADAERRALSIRVECRWSRLRARCQQAVSLLRQHAIAVLRGEVPHGPVNWIYVSVIEPALLLGAGVLMMAAGGPTRPFGIYLVILALALLFKAAVHRANWAEFVYDAHDQELEAAAIQNWRLGKSASEISRVFTVPVLRAVLPPKRADACEKIQNMAASNSTDGAAAECEPSRTA